MSGVRCSARGGPAASAKPLARNIAPALPHRPTATRQAHACIVSLSTTAHHKWRQLHDLYNNRQAIGRDAYGDRASSASRLCT
jgi:hypothetical protein